jgi:hypothetical protein
MKTCSAILEAVSCIQTDRKMDGQAVILKGSPKVCKCARKH